jgi:hypothetical protein
MAASYLNGTEKKLSILSMLRLCYINADDMVYPTLMRLQPALRVSV